MIKDYPNPDPKHLDQLEAVLAAKDSRNSLIRVRVEGTRIAIQAFRTPPTYQKPSAMASQNRSSKRNIDIVQSKPPNPNRTSARKKKPSHKASQSTLLLAPAAPSQLS
jgi:hypothetical protein